MNSPILITGAARSGTSMTAGCFHLAGAFGGVMSGPNMYNKKGMFENNKIRNQIVKPYLRKNGLDPLCQYPLPNSDNPPSFPHLRKRVIQVMKEQGYTKGPWFYKGAKMALLWKVFHEAFPNAKWILVIRPDEDIIKSCLKTKFMQRFSNPMILKELGLKNETEGWQWWVNRHKKAFVDMIGNGLDIKIIHTEYLINGEFYELKDALEWVGLKWTNKITKFVEPRLWKSRA